MANQRTSNGAILVKIETTPGVDAGPVAATDAVLVENVSESFTPNIINTNELTGSLDGRGPIVGGMTVSIGFDVYVKGSGTAGTPPEWGVPMKCCGFVETVTATAIPAAPEAMAAGGSSTAGVLGTSAGTAAEAYRGLPILLSSGTALQTSFISDYTTGKLAALTDTLSSALGTALGTGNNYQIPANVRYQPGSTSIPTATIYYYIDGILYKIVGAQGTVTGTLTSGGAWKLSFKFSGLFSSKTDAAVPSPIRYDATRPPIWKGGAALFNRLSAAMKTLSFDIGGVVTLADDPNQTEGYAPAQMVDRNVTGTVSAYEVLNANRNAMAAFRAMTPQIIHARCGSVLGNSVGITFPVGILTNQTPGDDSGLQKVDLPFAATGQDSGMQLTLY